MPSSTMSEMCIKVVDLAEAIQENMEVHREDFLQAQKVYSKEIVKWLEQSLEDARNGNKIVRHITLPEPEDHTADYERALRMLAMCQDTTIMISQHEFAQYVMDDWGWKAGWSATMSNYVDKYK